MTDALRRDLEEVAGRSADRPDLADLWRAGRRRRTRSRAVPLGAAAVLVLLIGTVLVLARPGDDGERVTATGPAVCDPAPLSGMAAPPETATAFVRGSGDGVVLQPTVVARVEVVRVWRVRLRRSSTLLTVPALVVPTHERRAEVRVVEAISGTRVGRRLVITDTATVRGLDATRRLRRAIDNKQDRLDAAPDDQVARAELDELLQRLQIAQLSERAMDPMIEPTPCHAFHTGDELIVALRRSQRVGQPYELTNPSSFFLIADGQLSPELDAARRSVPGWPDTPLARLARRSTPAELIAALRAAR